ncbi:Myc-type basic helix-loop-helix (bHLH) domain-containing protein [Dioscorea alata]|uniref:Myc-type basic helix-loop-helix (BHLH) domain-containing protein n=1 Tax=Dioscorea alata TaxID=55571 RepID=A0ACB7W9N8_DIOAL|nr:Myc-type basic helix-loop-helix (bHLH) domain-containing protein [Dioscorea alata]
MGMAWELDKNKKAGRRAESFSVNRRGRRPRRRMSCGDPIERKVRELRSLVPGSEDIDADDQLLSHTADYIFQLKLQLHVLKALCELYMV